MKSQNLEEGVQVDESSKAPVKHIQGKEEDLCVCKICGKDVYQMEKVKAVKSTFHRSCFRCKECNKQLSPDTYESHEGEIYCQLHLKQLFQPKANFEETTQWKKKEHKMIIRENTPLELPPDVVRYDSKVDDGLEALQLDLNNIRNRFEFGSEEEDRPVHHTSVADKCALQRSESIMVRLQRYQSAVSTEFNNKIDDDSSSDGDSSDDEEDTGVVRESKSKEKVSFTGMSSLKSQWENGKVAAKVIEEQVEPKEDGTKEELHKIRQKLCLGRSASMRQVYERGSLDYTPNGRLRSDSVIIGSQIKILSIKEKFEKGDFDNEPEEEKLEKFRQEKAEDLSVVNEGETASREAKNIFKKMDAYLTNGRQQRAIVSTTNGWHRRHNSIESRQNMPKTNGMLPAKSIE